MTELRYYAGDDVSLDRMDIRNMPALSIDLRAETGATGVRDESCVMPPGMFTLSVFKPTPGEYPVGEVRIWFEGREVRVVGHLTGRPGVAEVTPDHLAACIKDPTYRSSIRQWLGVAA